MKPPSHSSAAMQRRGSTRRLQWSLFHWLTAGMIVTFIWRFQQLFPVLAVVKATLLVSALATVVFLLRPDLPVIIEKLKRDRTMKYILLMLLWMVLSIPTSVYQSSSFYAAIVNHPKTVLFAVLLVAASRGIRDIERLAAVQVFGALVYSGFSYAGGMDTDGRLSGVATYDANDLALVLVMSLPLAVYLALKGRHLFRLMGLACVVFFPIVVVQTGSRGGFLGICAVAAFMLFRLQAVSKGLRGAVAVVGLAAFVGLAGAEYKAQLATILNPTQDYNWSTNSQAGRMAIWKRGFGYMLSRPVLGVGAAVFHVAEGKLSEDARRNAAEGRGFKWSTAHSAYVQVAAELGIPGIYFFLGILLTAYATTRRLSQAFPPKSQEAAMAQVLGASMAGYAVGAAFLSGGYAAYLYCNLGLIMGLSACCGPGRAPQAVAPGAARRGSVARTSLHPSVVSPGRTI